ncbi:MAG: CDP-alcohol phosphatidyltransferase family protein [Gemmatimonadota bacterium]
MKLFTLPNILSLSRLPLAAAFLLVESVPGRAAIVSAVALTDLADGFFARRLLSHDRRTGQLIDPITDKLFVVIALVALAVRRDISIAVLLIVLARDLYTTIGFLMSKALHWKIEFRARMIGKVTTVLQLVILLAVLFWPAAVRPLVTVVAVASALAIVDYTRAAVRQHRLATTAAGT